MLEAMTKLPAFRSLRRLLLAGFFTVAAGLAQAQGGAAVRILVGFPPGGGTDAIERTLADKLKDELGMPVVVSILLFILYYIFSMTGEKSAREDLWTMASGMWFSSFVFLPVGIWLTYKAVTDSSIMSAETYTNFFKKILPSKLMNRFFKNEDPATDQ